MKIIKIFCLLFLANALLSQSSNILSEWKGPNRNSILNEKGLLQEWPVDGPNLLWRFDSLTMGHSSPAVAEDAIYLTGMPDSISGILYCLDLDGKLLWKDNYGEEYKSSYMGSRSTPVVADNHLYFISGAGEVICYDLTERKKAWTLPFINRFHDTIPQFAYAESVLIDNDRLYCTPGGKKHSILCLDKNTGDIIWSSSGNGDKPTYSSAIMVNHEGNKILVVVLENSIVGINPSNGNMYWEIPYIPAYGSHANTPVYANGRIYMCSSVKKDDGGFIAIDLLNRGEGATILWERKDLANYLSGFIVINDKIYTNSGRKKKWFCLDAKTGETLYIWEDYKAGIPIYTDGLFYIFCEDGNVYLSKEEQNSFMNISTFKLDISTKDPFAPLWATPVIKDQKLFIRHKGTLFVYDIEK